MDSKKFKSLVDSFKAKLMKEFKCSSEKELVEEVAFIAVALNKSESETDEDVVMGACQVVGFGDFTGDMLMARCLIEAMLRGKPDHLSEEAAKDFLKDALFGDSAMKMMSAQEMPSNEDMETTVAEAKKRLSKMTAEDFKKLFE